MEGTTAVLILSEQDYLNESTKKTLTSPLLEFSFGIGYSTVKMCLKFSGWQLNEMQYVVEKQLSLPVISQNFLSRYSRLTLIVKVTQTLHEANAFCTHHRFMLKSILEILYLMSS